MFLQLAFKNTMKMSEEFIHTFRHSFIQQVFTEPYCVPGTQYYIISIRIHEYWGKYDLKDSRGSCPLHTYFGSSSFPPLHMF